MDCCTGCASLSREVSKLKKEMERLKTLLSPAPALDSAPAAASETVVPRKESKAPHVDKTG